LQEFKAVELQMANIAGIDGKSSEKITITSECPAGGSYRILNCQDSEITLLEKTEILFLKNLTNCKISCAVTKSTVFVDQCRGCTFDLNCHQLRIHNTFETRFNILVTSKAIIEDCKNVQFAQYQFEYPDRKRHEVEEERDGKPNLWRDIQDFNWLK
jgi:tubulin-specific chaperone C